MNSGNRCAAVHAGSSFAGAASALGRLLREYPAVALVFICLLFIVHAALYFAWIEDDAFITLRYAENMVQGHGLAFNPGQRVEGYSNLAWVLLAAGSMAVGIEPLLAVRLTGILCGVACLPLAWLMARRLRPGGGIETLLAPLFLAVSPILARHSTSGLETGAYAMFFTLGLLLIVVRERPQERLLPAVATLVMLFLLRPEGAAFGILFLVLAGRAGAKCWKIRAFFCVALAVFLVWRWWYFDSLLPNTYHFKMTGGETAYRMGSYHVRMFLRDSGGVALISFSLVVLMNQNTVCIMRRLLVVFLCQILLIVAAGGDWMHHYRFFVPVMPLLAAAMAAGIGFTHAAARRCRGDTLVPWFALAAVLGLTYSGIYLDEKQIWRQIMPAVREGSYLSQSYARVGEWLRVHSRPGSTVAISDVGAVGYYSKRMIIDMFGLVDPHIARTPGELHAKQNPGYVLAQSPDYVVLVQRTDKNGQPWYWRLPDRTLAAKPEFAVGYRLVHSIAMGFEDETACIYRRILEP